MRHILIVPALALSAAATAAPAQTLLFDFGNTARQSDPTSFNNLVPAVQSIADCIDDNGANTGIGIAITNPFFLIGEPSQGGSESPSGAAAQFGVAATDDYFFGHTGAFAGEDSNPLSVLELQNLSQSNTYDLTIFASRSGVNDNRETFFEAFGTEIVSGALAVSNNDSQVLVLSGITPDQNGVISLSVFAGPNNDNGNAFYYFGAMRVDVVPAPASLALLGLGGLAATRRKR